MLHALSPKTFLKNFQVSTKNQRMKPDNKIETERIMERYENTNQKIMSRKKWVIEKRMEIAGCHKLTLGGHVSPCSRLHGHNWIVGVKVEGMELNNDGMVLDFTFISDVVKRLDHRHLNDVLGKINPTDENMARWIAEEIQKLIDAMTPEPEYRTKVIEVSVQESEGNKALYLIS